jgi:hypothetical protein
MVHLKLRGDYPAEIQEAAVIQDDSGRRYTWLKVALPQGTRRFSVPLGVEGEPDVTCVPPSLREEFQQRFRSPAYHRLRRDLQQLARSLP